MVQLVVKVVKDSLNAQFVSSWDTSVVGTRIVK
jgi:hypothetical protein